MWPMINGMSVLAIVPARGGSKGIPRKNILPVGGKPLLAWTVEAARESRFLDRTVLSSEDPEIITTAKGLGLEVPFVRPPELAQDDTPGVMPILHALEHLPGPDLVVVLQPTSPLRRGEDIDGALRLLAETGAPCVVSVCETEHNPFWMYFREADGRMRPVVPQDRTILRRQELPAVYRLNGAVYVARRDWLLANRTFLTPETLAYVMPLERSLDLDRPEDLAVLEHALNRKKG